MKKFLLIQIVLCLSQKAHSQDNWTNYTTANSGLLSPVVRALEADHLDRIWVGYSWDGYGISVFDGDVWTTIDTSNGLPDNRVNAIFEDGNNAVWCGTQNGLCRFDGSAWTTFTTTDGLANNNILSIYEDTDDNLWVGTVNGLSKFNGMEWTNYTTNNGLANNYIYAIEQDMDGNMWFAYGLVPSGVTKFDGTNWTTYKKPDGLSSNQVNTILSDHNGDLWFGCYGFDAAISKYDGETWASYSPDSLTTCYNVWATLEDDQNKLWFGTSCNGGTITYNNSTWAIYNTNNCGIISNNILQIVEDTPGNIWLGGYDGLSKYSQPSTGVNEKKTNNNFFRTIQNGSEITFITDPEEKHFQIGIFSPDGKIVHSAKVSGPEYSINTAEFAKGIYFVLIFYNNKMYSEKIIVH